jgi:hypothetical protein
VFESVSFYVFLNFISLSYKLCVNWFAKINLFLPNLFSLLGTNSFSLYLVIEFNQLSNILLSDFIESDSCYNDTLSYINNKFVSVIILFNNSVEFGPISYIIYSGGIILLFIASSFSSEFMSASFLIKFKISHDVLVFNKLEIPPGTKLLTLKEINNINNFVPGGISNLLNTSTSCDILNLIKNEADINSDENEDAINNKIIPPE